MNSIFKRRSIRTYQTRKVEEEKVTKLLEAAMAAPSAGNQQPWEFYVVSKKETLEALAACSPYAGCAQNAPLAIVPCCRKDAYFPENVEMDLSAATENILLEAVELDLGAVWLGIAPLEDRMEKVVKVLDLPEYLTPFAIIPVGYPKQDAVQENRYNEQRVHYVK